MAISRKADACFMSITKIQFSGRISSLAKSLIEIEREESGVRSDADAMEALIVRGSTSDKAHKLMWEEASKVPLFAAVMKASSSAKGDGLVVDVLEKMSDAAGRASSLAKDHHQQPAKLVIASKHANSPKPRKPALSEARSARRAAKS